MENMTSRFLEFAFFGNSPAWTYKILDLISEEKLLPLAQRTFFRITLRHAYRHSKFYRRLFDSHGIDIRKIKKPQDLGAIFTESDDLRKNSSDDFVCEKPITAYQTTGTTSPLPKRVFFSASEVRKYGKVGGTGLWKMGIRPEDKVASAFDYSFWISGPTLKASLDWMQAFHVEAGKIDPKDFYDQIQPYQCNIFVGDPSWLLRLSEVAEKRGSWPVKMILAGGENMTEKTRNYIEGVWKTDVLLTYGQTEGFGSLGVECKQKDGYHLNDFMFYFEIINPDSDGYGEIVYTTFNRMCMPLIRYRSGDVARRIEGVCPCGLGTTKISKLRGRVDEMIACGMGNISPWMFDQIFRQIQMPVESYQLAVLKPENKDILEFRLELASPEEGPAVEKNILAVLEKDFPDYWKSYLMGLFEITFRFYAPGALRTGRKLKKLVDERSELIRDGAPEYQLPVDR
ncbi:MAG: phenylacetate--CoA ligase family protein [Candidatus Omnitrophica bacterium]|nr:phenylacetate--CoA ligase family protein [Candidatus Omnitrophota bacterium]